MEKKKLMESDEYYNDDFAEIEETMRMCRKR